MRQPQASPEIIRVILQSDYIVTNVMSTVTGMEIIVPKDGFYNLKGFLNEEVRDADGTTAGCYTHIAINDLLIPNTKSTSLHNDTSTGLQINISVMLNTGKFLQKNDIVTLKAQMTAGDNSKITTGALTESVLEIERL